MALNLERVCVLMLFNITRSPAIYGDKATLPEPVDRAMVKSDKRQSVTLADVRFESD